MAVEGYVLALKGGNKAAQAAGAGLAKASATGAASGSPQVNAVAQQKNTVALNGSTASLQRVVTSSRLVVVAQTGFAAATNVATSAMGIVAKSAKGMAGMMKRHSGKISGGLGGLTSLVFAASMFEGPMQEMSQKIMPAVLVLLLCKVCLLC